MESVYIYIYSVFGGFSAQTTQYLINEHIKEEVLEQNMLIQTFGSFYIQNIYAKLRTIRCLYTSLISTKTNDVA